MNAIRRFLADTADLIFDLLAAVGLSGPRWQFRRQAVRRSLLEPSQDAENLRRSIQVKHAMCRECRALIPRGARQCPECGASTRGISKGGIGRVVRLLFPGFASVTSVIVTVNFVAYAVSLALAPSSGRSDFLGLGGPGVFGLWMLGDKFHYTLLGAPLWQLYRLVMPNLLHGGLIHILMNTLALMNLGPMVEHLVGRRRFFLIYLGTGMGGFALSSLRPGHSIGASAAIFGLLGFLVVFGRLRGGEAGRVLSSYLMRWVFFGVVLLLMPFIDHLAHLGGFLVGAAAGLVVRGRRALSPRHERLLTLAAVLAVLIVVASVAGVVLDWETNRAIWEQNA